MNVLPACMSVYHMPEDIRTNSLRSGVTGGCELLWVLRIELWSSARVTASKQGTNSPAPATPFESQPLREKGKILHDQGLSRTKPALQGYLPFLYASTPFCKIEALEFVIAE